MEGKVGKSLPRDDETELLCRDFGLFLFYGIPLITISLICVFGMFIVPKKCFEFFGGYWGPPLTVISQLILMVANLKLIELVLSRKSCAIWRDLWRKE